MDQCVVVTLPIRKMFTRMPVANFALDWLVVEVHYQRRSFFLSPARLGIKWYDSVDTKLR